MTQRSTISVLFLTVIVVFAASPNAAEPVHVKLETGFGTVVQPLLKSYCIDCHGGTDPEAKLDLTIFRSAEDVITAVPVWETVLQRLRAGDMPPSDSPSPSDRERNHAIQWIGAMRRSEAERNAGDPGPVLVRRLSNAEYDHSIRDLTGVDIRPTSSFPIDPANAAGFDNSGESLTMSPALLNKYLLAARDVAAHLVLTPTGIAFAPHPVITDTDRDKYCVKRIVNFYRKQPTDLAGYFYAAWLLRDEEQPVPAKRLESVATQQKLSPPYLRRIAELLRDKRQSTGPLATLQSRWKELCDQASHQTAIRDQCEDLAAFVRQIRLRLTPSFRNLMVEGNHRGSQPFVLWKNDQYAAARRHFDETRLISAATAIDGEDVPPELIVPDDPERRRRLMEDLTLFCDVFPDAFFVSERGRDYLGKPRDEQEKGRLLSAGFHSMMGYYRDDQPLYDLILDAHARAEIDALWKELDFISDAPRRQYAGFLWFERTDSRFMRDPEFDFARPENRSAASEVMIRKLGDRYLAKAKRSGGDDDALEAIRRYFQTINRQIRWVEEARKQSESTQLAALIRFAEKCYRRPLSRQESKDLRQFHRTLQTVDGLSHEDALRDLLVAILMSPHFCYRLDLGEMSSTSNSPSNDAGPVPLSDHELASRLSYFLWSSVPDSELMRAADSGQLRKSDELRRQVQRMLRDPRMRGMAIEFGANWLDFRRFLTHNAVDRNRFPEFNDALREAMFEEPVRFFVDMARNNRSILEFLKADYTFVNPTLARHYGWDVPSVKPEEWTRVKMQRGGLLSMAVFLTANSPGLRTSPVKRGYWVAKRLLGEHIPPPPPDVPDLPAAETQPNELTLPELLARHRDDPSCSGCHRKFDSLGLVFEGYGPIGERRQRDLGGRPVIDSAQFPDGSKGTGVEGLKDYLLRSRQEDFIMNFCRKLLSYGLSRSLVLSDELLVEAMQQSLKSDAWRFQTAIEQIVLSPQFRNRRGADPIATGFDRNQSPDQRRNPSESRNP